VEEANSLGFAWLARLRLSAARIINTSTALRFTTTQPHGVLSDPTNQGIHGGGDAPGEVLHVLYVVQMDPYVGSPSVFADVVQQGHGLRRPPAVVVGAPSFGCRRRSAAAADQKGRRPVSSIDAQNEDAGPARREMEVVVRFRRILSFSSV
jgi:hypothetical protein